MNKNKIKTITVYSQYNFIENLLTQTCKDFFLKTTPYSSLTFTATNTKASISVIDVKNQTVFNEIIKSYLRAHIFHFLIILAPNNLISAETFSHNSAIILFKPLKYQTLLKTINHYTTSFIDKLAHNVFLNAKTLSIIKISRKKKTEIKLTNLEYKILKYLLKISKSNNKKIATEKEILTNVFEYHVLSNTNTLKAHIYRLKRKLGIDLDIIKRSNNKYAIKISV